MLAILGPSVKTVEKEHKRRVETKVSEEDRQEREEIRKRIKLIELSLPIDRRR